VCRENESKKRKKIRVKRKKQETMKKIFFGYSMQKYVDNSRQKQSEGG